MVDTKFKKGNTPWLKLHPELAKPNSGSFKKGQKKLSNAYSFSKGNKINLGRPSWNKGKKCPQLSGKNNGGWIDGRKPINNIIRGSLEYKLWQDSVFNLGFNCCKKCGERRVSLLVAHHILNFAQYPELRFALDNGVTFCRPCHKEFHKKYGKKNNNLEQVKEFIQCHIN